ncbi:DUF5690 family protein [Flavobacterium beibuense]|uniref:DUF5690 family protein n=1 Tax=Flavobacterium beibuense TaxID=657326 RepID=UPI003A922C9A
MSTVWIMLSAFLCYTGMYAVRKSFLAGQYQDLDFGYGLDAKTILVISQVMGYMLSKFLGIKLISEMPKHKRANWLIGFVLFGLSMLGLFSILPNGLKPLALFLNGLPLGMVFGVVISYIEGRRNSEMLAAALSATFIFSTGLVKTVGVVLMQDYSISEYNMPFFTGLFFMPLFIIAVWMLKRAKDPCSMDVEERSERVPMYARERKDFLKQNGWGYFGLVAIYILLTVVRDFRDNFIVEFWAEQGYSQAPQVITLTEIPVAVIVLVITAMGILIRNNSKAFNTGMWLTISGAVVILVSTMLFEKGYLSPVFWTIISGIGIYLPYILFHCLLFERLIALLSYRGNVGFLFYLADALGYLGSVVVLILKEVTGFKQSWVAFFTGLNIKTAVLVLIISLLTMLYFNRKITVVKIQSATA